MKKHPSKNSAPASRGESEVVLGFADALPDLQGSTMITAFEEPPLTPPQAGEKQRIYCSVFKAPHVVAFPPGSTGVVGKVPTVLRK